VKLKEELEKKDWIVFKMPRWARFDLLALKPKVVSQGNTSPYYDVRVFEVKSTSKKVWYSNERSKVEWGFIWKLKELLGLRGFFYIYFKGKGKPSTIKIIEVLKPEPPRKVRMGEGGV